MSLTAPRDTGSVVPTAPVTIDSNDGFKLNAETAFQISPIPQEQTALLLLLSNIADKINTYSHACHIWENMGTNPVPL